MSNSSFNSSIIDFNISEARFVSASTFSSIAAANSLSFSIKVRLYKRLFSSLIFLFDIISKYFSLIKSEGRILSEDIKQIKSPEDIAIPIFFDTSSSLY